MHYVPIFDPGVSAGEANGTYPPYDVGIEMQVFVKNSKGKEPFRGRVLRKKAKNICVFLWALIMQLWTDTLCKTNDDYLSRNLKANFDCRRFIRKSASKEKYYS